MRKTWAEIKNETMSKAEQRHAAELARRELARMELAELREALQVSQEELADRLKVTQAAISRLERRPNLLLESLVNYIRALGGRLELHAVLPNGTVKLTHLFGAADTKAVGFAPKKKRNSAGRVRRAVRRRAAGWAN
jgi:transcriptional regulator with XRE-family HTH domain